MWSAGPDDIDDALTERDVTDQAERFIVSIDPSHTRRIAYSFAVTAAGVRADWIHTDDTRAIAIRRGIRCGSRAPRSSPMAGPPRWRFR